MEVLMVSRNLAKFFSDESGVSLVEYCLIAALVAVVAIGALGTIGTNLNTTLDDDR
jgi:pilus assembly protein Flp/PilA